MSDEEIKWMFCNKCKKTVLQNSSGECLKCQGRYSDASQPDSWANMHACKTCGCPVAFLAQGCVDCTGEIADE